MTLFTAWLLGLDTTPSPIPEFTGDADAVTPGVIGFVAIFLIAVATVLLVLDMTRRVRRVRYRAEIRERLEAEAAGEKPTTPAPGDSSQR
jgi:hypothetical protein